MTLHTGSTPHLDACQGERGSEWEEMKRTRKRKVVQDHLQQSTSGRQLGKGWGGSV